MRIAVAARPQTALPSLLMRVTRELKSDTRGGASVEYIVLVGTVGLVVMAALVAVGPPLIADYRAVRSTVASPYP
jgi:Flp pilus assembly pilin Flp